MAIPLLEGLSRPKRLLADKAYDAISLRRWLKRRRIRALIPSLATRTFPFPLDRKAYKRRNVIERMWGRLKNQQCGSPERLPSGVMEVVAIGNDCLDDPDGTFLGSVTRSEQRGSVHDLREDQVELFIHCGGQHAVLDHEVDLGLDFGGNVLRGVG